MNPASVILIGGQSPQTYWNGIADIGLLMAIDDLREQVVGAINASRAGQPLQPHDPSLDYGTRPTA